MMRLRDWVNPMKEECISRADKDSVVFQHQPSNVSLLSSTATVIVTVIVTVTVTCTGMMAELLRRIIDTLNTTARATNLLDLSSTLYFITIYMWICPANASSKVVFVPNSNLQSRSTVPSPIWYAISILLLIVFS
jgi:hypothetical protein